MRTTLYVSLSLLLCGASACGTSGTQTPKLDGGGTVDMAGAGTPDMAKAVHDMALPINSGPCDPIAQDCIGAGLKCTLIDDGAGKGMLTTGCVMAGPDKVGDSCTRVSMMPADIGNDSCAKTSFCSNIGTLALPSQLHCRLICTADADCGAAPNKCINETQQPNIGVCAPTCVVLGDSKDCPAMFKCDALYFNNDTTTPNFICRLPGKVALGATCMLPTDCVANALCIDPNNMGGTQYCTALCDDTHACTKGKCMPVTMGTKIGFCI